MKIVIPIAGLNNKDESSQYIRSLYEIERKTVLQYVCEALSEIESAEFLFVLRREDVCRLHFDYVVRLLVPDCTIVIADGDTHGAACTCLLAVDYLQEEEELLIVGCDQLITMDLNKILEYFRKGQMDGGTVVFDDIHPRWSFVKLDENGFVVEAAEKRPISRNATTGFYYFKRAGDFTRAAEQMIKKGADVNGQYYVCPVFNEMILKQKKIGTFRIEKTQYFNFNHQEGMESYEKYITGRNYEE